MDYIWTTACIYYGLVQLWLSSEFFSSNYFQIGQHVVLLHILVGGLANLSYPFNHCVKGENEPDKKIERQRTPPSELILFWDHVTRPNQGLSLSRSEGTGRREPWERGCCHAGQIISQTGGKIECLICIHNIAILVRPFNYFNSIFVIFFMSVQSALMCD